MKSYSSRGDTLIEVALALSILALVLISSYAVAARAFRLGQDAQNRRQVSAKMVEQAEELRNLRDNEATWSAFLNVINAPLLGQPIPAFYLLINSGLPGYNPGPEGAANIGVAGAAISITGSCKQPFSPPPPGSDPRGDYCKFTITGTWPSSQNPAGNSSTMNYWLVNNKLLQAESQ